MHINIGTLPKLTPNRSAGMKIRAISRSASGNRGSCGDGRERPYREDATALMETTVCESAVALLRSKPKMAENKGM